MAKKSQAKAISISKPNFAIVALRLQGSSPLMMHKFSEKMRKQMEEKQTAENATKKKREPKDYVAEYNDARYISGSGWDGVPAIMIRAAMIAACRYVDGLPMTAAKGAFFIHADGRDTQDGTPLVKIHGKPEHDKRPVRLESGVADIRNRPRYDDWHIDVTIEYDADMLSQDDIANLLMRAGMQVGIGELRPQGKKSFGGDFGMWTLKSVPKVRAVA